MFLYELHCHTSESSKCGSWSGAELADYYKSLHYDGVFITDHFLNGNTAIPKDLSWDERLDLFFRGYETAKAEGGKIGLKVFCAWEYHVGQGTEFLTYGLNKKHLYEHPEIMEMKPYEYAAFVRENGGFLTHAHPFREASYIRGFHLYPYDVDAVEIYNSGNRCPEFNERAKMYSLSYGLKELVGSDKHGINDRFNAAFGSETQICTEEDFISAVKNGAYKNILVDINGTPFQEL